MEHLKLIIKCFIFRINVELWIIFQTIKLIHLLAVMVSKSKYPNMKNPLHAIYLQSKNYDMKYIKCIVFTFKFINYYTTDYLLIQSIYSSIMEIFLKTIHNCIAKDFIFKCEYMLSFNGKNISL